MFYKITVALTLIFLNVPIISCSGEITGCSLYVRPDGTIYQYIVRLHCKDGRFDVYDINLVDCYEKMFQIYRDEVNELYTENCRGHQLSGLFRNRFSNLLKFNISGYGVNSLSSDDLNFEYLEKFRSNLYNLEPTLGGKESILRILTKDFTKNFVRFFLCRI